MKRLILVAALLALASPAIAQTTGEVGVVTDMWASTDAKAGQDLEIFDNANPAAPLRIIPMGGRGAIDNLDDIIHLRGVDIGFVPSDAIVYARENHLIPATDLAKIQYIAKLYDEEVHIIAGSNVATVADLNGKRINADVPGSGSAMTADIILRAMNIHADVRHDRQAEGVLALRHGDIDAIIQVGGAPVPIIAGIPSGGLHFVPLPMTVALSKTYLPTEITHAEYPALVNGDPVPTVAIGDVLAVFAWAPNTQRYRNVARFTDALFNGISDLQKPPRHPKWQDVNLAASVPGWVRFSEAVAKLRDRFLLDEQNRLASDYGIKQISPDLARDLVRDYEVWRARTAR